MELIGKIVKAEVVLAAGKFALAATATVLAALALRKAIKEVD